MRKKQRPPTHPGGILRRHYIETLSMTVSGLAVVLGVSRKTLSEIVNEHASITPDMALRLSKAFKTTPELWLNMQRNYDLWQALQKSDDWKHVEILNQDTI